ncbi:MAG TPA: response regulator [Actinomycetes bacterium]|nr:response regulator [Actinomycetes bacterium]
MRALILDDSRAMRMILRRIMHSAGFEVVEAADGGQGLAALAGGPLPDVALVDWNMPGIDGLAFVNAVRDNPDYRPMTLMMVTTESEHDQVVRALAAGAHEYIIKPFTADAIVDKLELLGLVPE